MSGHATAQAHGVIGLVSEKCTVCMICVEECPVWCIEIGAHIELDAVGSRRPVRRSVLDSFTLDYGLCMYCGICVEACPFDALHWASLMTPPELVATDLVHDARRLAGWQRNEPIPPSVD